jgi:septal ring factor EnvC (AmiA/AmiB activator)
MRLILVFIALGFGLLNVQAQTRSQLENQRKKIQNEIKLNRELLGQTRADSEDALEQLSDIESQISLQESLISNTQKTLNALSKDLKKKEDEIQQKKDELQALIDEYKKVIYESYKSKSTQVQLMYILASESFTQAYKRLAYLNQYGDYRRAQAEEIKELQLDLEADLLILEQERIVQNNLLVESRSEKAALEKDKEKVESLRKAILEKEQFYIAEINKKQAQEDRLDKQIDELIKRAIAESRKKTKTTVKSGSSTGFALTPEAKALEAKFASNKGKLPWPVKRGVVTRKYGVQPHETLKGIKIRSNGIRIATSKGADALAVFNGTVLAVQKQSDGSKIVILQHGNYLTFYKNLIQLKVAKGDEVKTGQSLGVVVTNKVKNKTELGFALMKQITRENPANWLSPR